MSSTQAKREKFDYRSAHFQLDPGFFGNYYQCVQCGKIISRRATQVDHIVPLKSALGLNASVNTASTCEHCNKSKGAKMDERVVQGFVFKMATLPMRYINRLTVKKVSKKASTSKKLLNMAMKSGLLVVGSVYMLAIWYLISVVNLFKTFVAEGSETLSNPKYRRQGKPWFLPLKIVQRIVCAGGLHMLKNPLTWITLTGVALVCVV